MSESNVTSLLGKAFAESRPFAPNALLPIAKTLTENYIASVLAVLEPFTSTINLGEVSAQVRTNVTRETQLLLNPGFSAAEVSAALSSVEVEGHPYTGTMTTSQDGNVETYLSDLTPPGAMYTATGTTKFNKMIGCILLSFRFVPN